MMRKRIFYCLTALTACILLTALTRKDDALDTILNHFEKIRTEYPQEKVHLHFDKDYYSVGDDMWFKAYVVNAEKNQLSALSKVLYVDILDDLDSVHKTLLLPIESGLAEGDINLSDSLFDAGKYHIRAYTKWMTNFDNEYFFSKTILIGDALKSPVNAVAGFTIDATADKQTLTASITFKDLNNAPLTGNKVTYTLTYQNKVIRTGKAITDAYGKLQISELLKNDINSSDVVLNTSLAIYGRQSVNRSFKVARTAASADVKFFPEGGALVNGLRSKVGFKVLGNDGLGLAITGYIEDETGKKQLDIYTKFAGMGVFALQPIAGKKYTAIIQFADGSKQKYPLPVAQESGYTLGLNHIGADSLAISIGATADLLSGKELTLVAQSNAAVQYLTKIRLDRALTNSYIPASKFNAGITQFTLFAPDYTPVAERLVFVGQQSKLKLSINNDKPAYTKRQKVNIDLTVLDDKNLPVKGSFSIAITDQDKVATNEDEETTILSNLLLTSDIKGYVEKPNYYFTSITKEKVYELDALMLTQGWRRFKWADIQAGKFPAITYPADKGLAVSGRITTLGGKPMPYGKVTLFGSSKFGPILADTVADANGRFVFEPLDFADSARFVVKAKSAKDRNSVRIVLDKETSLPVNYVNNKDVNGMFDPSFVSYLKSTEKRFNEMYKFNKIDKTIQLKEVQVRDRMPPKIYKSEFPSDLRADFTLTPDKLQSAGELSEVMRGQIGVTVMFNKVWGTRYGDRGQMLILLDGKVMNSLDGISPMALAGVQILKGSNTTESLGMIAGGRYDRLKEIDKMPERSAFYGIIYLTTERRVTKYNSPPPLNINYARPKGYAIAREFYSPAYDAPKADDYMTDLRSTIYWKPNIITDDKGNAKISYFTADDAGKYRVVIEGLDLNGNLLRQVSSITVK